MRLRYITSDSVTPKRIANSSSANSVAAIVTSSTAISARLAAAMCLMARKSIRFQATMNSSPAIAASGR